MREAASGNEAHQQRLEDAGRVHIVAQRGMHIHLGALKTARHLAFTRTPSVVCHGKVHSTPCKGLHSVEELGQRTVGAHSGFALAEHAVPENGKLHGIRPVVHQEQQPTKQKREHSLGTVGIKATHRSARAE